MRFGADFLQDFGFDRAVNLDLIESRVVIAINGGACFFGRVGTDDPDGSRVLAVDNSGKQHSWSKPATFFYRVANGNDKIEFVSDIARGRYAGGEINRSPFDLSDMCVHVE